MRLEGLRGKLQEVLERGKVVRSTRAMLTRLRDNKEEELLALQKELDAFEESAQNEEESDEEETDSESEETHHDKDIGISKGITGSQTEEVEFKAPKKIHVRSQGKRDS